MIPHCQLSAEYTEKEEKVPNLKHKVNMIGAKEPFTYFLLKFDPHKNRPLPLPRAKCKQSVFNLTSVYCTVICKAEVNMISSLHVLET